jgi:hypothetical protein
MREILQSIQKNQGSNVDSAYVPLGAIIYAFLAFPLGASCKFDEVEVHTYLLNGSALYASNYNIADIPVPVETLNKVVKELQSPNGLTFVRAILDDTVSSSNYFIYGLSDLFEKRTELEKKRPAPPPKPADPKNITADEKKAQEANEKAQEGFKSEMDSTNDYIEDQIESRARAAGSPTGDFIAPDVRVVVESLPLTGGTSKVKCRIHVFDRNRTMYADQQTMIRSLTATDIVSAFNTKVGDANTKVPVDGSEILSKIDATFNREKMFEIIERVLPTIKVGTEATVITRAAVSSNTSGALADAYLVETLRNIKDPQISKGSTVTGATDVTIIPSTLTISMIGMPRVGYGQEFLVDLGTGTTLDNIYRVSGLSHRIASEGFTTNITLSPTYQASFKSIKTSIKTAVASLTQT